VHQDQTFEFEYPPDALKHAPYGGCTLICEDILSCGHKCNSICHTMDHSSSSGISIEQFEENCVPAMTRIGPPGGGLELCAMHTTKGAANLIGAHTSPLFEVKTLHSSETICWEPCSRKCDAGIHNCKKPCYVKCGSDCAEIVCKELPCGHSAYVKCFTLSEHFYCFQEVEKEFPLCQHTSIVQCWSNKCRRECTSQMPCGHSCDRNCHLDYDTEHLLHVCRKPCSKRKKNCSAYHPCTKACHEDCDLCIEKVLEATFKC
jgi:hypothetical protein